MGVTTYKELLAASVAVFGIVLIVGSMWGFIERYRITMQPDENTDSLVTSDSASKSVNYQIQTLVDAHLFGTAEQKQPSVEEAPKTKLKLNLLGVLATDNTDYARALIQVQSHKMKAYAVGDVIEGTDAALHKVENQRVILDRQGKFESLAMVRKNIPPPEESAEAVGPGTDVQGTSLSPANSSPLPF